MTPEDRVLRLENAFSTLAELAATQSRRTDEHERKLDLLVELARNHSERMDEYERRTEALAELVVKQAELSEKQVELAEKQSVRMEEFAEFHKQIDARLAVLATIVEELGRAQKRTETTLNRLIERLGQ